MSEALILLSLTRGEALYLLEVLGCGLGKEFQEEYIEEGIDGDRLHDKLTDLKKLLRGTKEPNHGRLS